MAEQENKKGQPKPTAQSEAESGTAEQTGFVLANHEILVRPLVTEKGVKKAQRNNQYAFEVCPLATKGDVRRAVEELFNVRVDRVCTQNRRGKERRHRFRLGHTKVWKKAIVTLHQDDKIDFF